MSPATRQWPGVLKFLGYDPRPQSEALGDQLKRFRETKGWSQAEAAMRIGVSESVVWRWEGGSRKPMGRYLARVYQLLGGDPRPGPATVGECLKRHREQAGLTLMAMAKRLRVAQSTLCRWESGEREPAGAYLARAEAMLRCAEGSKPPRT